MTRLVLTVAPGECRVSNCARVAGTFGVCFEHEEPLVDALFEQTVNAGDAQADTPDCFASDQQWRGYVVAWVLAHGRGGNKLPRVDFCRDCTMSHKEHMINSARCEHEETVFVRTDKTEEVIGISLAHDLSNASRYEAALMGSAGEVIKLPRPHALEDAIARITASEAPKRRGRPPKSDYDHD